VYVSAWATPDDRAQAAIWGTVPRAYARLSEDASMPLAMQDRLIRERDVQAPDNPYVVRTPASSHLSWLVHPAAAADALAELGVSAPPARTAR